MNTPNKPDIVQAFDFYEDRVYKKIIPGFFFDRNITVRTDTIKNWKEWHIQCEEMPDKVFINGNPYSLREVI